MVNGVMDFKIRLNKHVSPDTGEVVEDEIIGCCHVSIGKEKETLGSLVEQMKNDFDALFNLSDFFIREVIINR